MMWDHKSTTIDCPFLSEEPSKFAASGAPFCPSFSLVLADELEVHINWPWLCVGWLVNDPFWFHQHLERPLHLKGSLVVWWLWLAKDLPCSKQAGVVILSNWGPEVNNSRVLAIIRVAGMS